MRGEIAFLEEWKMYFKVSFFMMSNREIQNLRSRKDIVEFFSWFWVESMYE